MRVSEHTAELPATPDHAGLLAYLARHAAARAASPNIVRFVITGMDRGAYQCEFGVVEGDVGGERRGTSVFEFRPRASENQDAFNAVFLVPTGIGAEVGGHAGDAGPACRLLAGCCDRLITHPNTVNASDINDMPDNAVYVEGSVISRLMMGTVGLAARRMNRTLVVLEAHPEPRVTDWAINAVNAARASSGFHCPEVVVLSPSFEMEAVFTGTGRAVGSVDRLERLFDALDARKGLFDAVALTSVIRFPLAPTLAYWTGQGSVNQGSVNPWGGVEAMLTHAVSAFYDVPSAHSPELIHTDWLERAAEEIGDPMRALAGLGVVEPTMAAEVISMTFLHCILKGLHRSPGIVTDPAAMGRPGVLTASDVSCLVQPDRCIGLPTLAALENGIPVVAVRDRTNVMRGDLTALPWRPGQLLFAENYIEAAGLLTALRAGVDPGTVRRPLARARLAHVA